MGANNPGTSARHPIWVMIWSGLPSDRQNVRIKSRTGNKTTMLNISDSVNKFADSLKINWPNFDIKPFDMPEMPEAINIKELMPDNAGKALFCSYV